MAKYFETLYKYLVNSGMTVNAINARLKHIDDRLDALESRMPDDTGTPLSAEGHTHKYFDRIGLWLPGRLVREDLSPYLRVDMNMTVKGVSAACHINEATGVVELDVQRSSDRGITWESILTTYINIDPGELTSDTASTQPVLNSSKVALTSGMLLRLYVVTSDSGVIDPCVTVKSEIATTA